MKTRTVTHSPNAQDIGRMDLNLLEIFDVVMTERHVTRAAARLGMTQSAISNALNRLRKRFNDQLFNKAARGISPTPKAVLLWPRIHSAIAHLRESMQPISFDALSSTECFRIALADLTAALIAPHLYGEIYKTAPNLNLHFVPYDARENVLSLMRGELDFAFVIDSPRNSATQTTPLWSDNFVVAARRDHPLLKGNISLSDFCTARQLIVNESGNQEVMNLIDQTLGQQRLSRQVSLCVNQFLVVPRVLRESDLIAVVPSKFAVTLANREHFTFVPLPIKVPDVIVSLSMHQRHTSSPAHLWLKERLIAIAHAIARYSKT